MNENNCALVLGGYVNGYSIIQELYDKNVENIVLFDTFRNVASYSNKIKKFVLIDNTSVSLRNELEKLHVDYDRIIVFPTDDLQLENLHEISGDVSSFCFLPFNSDNLLQSLDKFVQYEFCEKLGVPYPKTVHVQNAEDLDNVLSLKFPVLLKPGKREDLSNDVFRNLQLQTVGDLEKYSAMIKDHLDAGTTFLASEIIPGDGSNIYAYVGYRSRDGEILNEWTGKKLSQYPDDFGVFSSSSNEAPDEILSQGRILLNGMNLMGIAEPEFKYDYRDGKYKLMEINLRSMMWHRVGNLSGVNIQYSQYLNAIGEKVEKQSQIKSEDIHFVYLKHEIINLITRKGYSRIMFNNIFTSDKTCIALFDMKDIKPFLKDCVSILKSVGGVCLKALGII